MTSADSCAIGGWFKQPTDGGYPHGRAVAVAAVGLGVGISQPPAEHSAVSRIREFLPIGLQKKDELPVNVRIIRIRRNCHEGVGMTLSSVKAESGENSGKSLLLFPRSNS